MRKVKKFPIGGTHLPENKELTTDSEIRDISLPERVVILLKQHLGVPCRSLVTPGDHVTTGQRIGANDQGLSSPVHASVTGTVVAVESRRQLDGADMEAIIIDSPSGSQAPPRGELPLLGPNDPVPDAETVISRVESAGVVGMGGATFPSHVKLRVKKDTPIDSVIINGAECEPYITTDDRLMQEQAAELFRGLEIIRRTVGAGQGYVACEINKPDAVTAILAEAERWPHLSAVRLDTRYPHGAEKHLIKAVLDREVPIRQLPMSVGVVVNNVQTAIAIAQAVDHEIPLTHRVLTVSGSACTRPANLRVPIGTPLRDLLDAVDGPSTEEHRIIIGGPMTGTTTTDMELPVTKGTSGVVMIRSEEYADRRTEVCIRCARCVSVCPMYLQPNRITTFVRHEMVAEAEEFGVNDCILCGACSFICPSRRPLLQWLREGKAMSAAKQKQEAR